MTDLQRFVLSRLLLVIVIGATISCYLTLGFALGQ